MNHSWFSEFARRARVSDHRFPRWTYDRLRTLYRWIGRTWWFLGLGWVDSVRRMHRDGEGWVLEGWAYHRGTDFGDDPQFRAWLVRRGRKVPVPAETQYDMEARAAAKAAEHDYALNSFRIAVPDAVVDELPPGSQWTVRVEVRGNGHRVRGRIRRVSRLGSAAFAHARPRTDGALAGPVADEQGLRFGVLPAARSVSSIAIDGRRLDVVVGPGVAGGRLIGLDQQPVVMTAAPAADHTVLSCVLPEWVEAERDVAGDRRSWRVETSSGRHWVPLLVDADTDLSLGSRSIHARRAPGEVLEVVETPVLVEVDRFELVEGRPMRMTFAGSVVGSGEITLELRSRFEAIAVSTTVVDGRFEATADLEVSRWGGPAKPPPLGAYSLVVVSRGRAFSTFLDRSVGDGLPVVRPTEEYRLRVTAAGRDQLGARFGPPRTDEEFGAWRQLQMRARFTTGEAEPIDAVYFESFFGRNATCNPMAIDAELARLHPDVPRYWGVQDLSIVVPEGATPLVRGTEEWWRIRSSARWVVTNEWLRTTFVKQPFQTVMQTWHGSMFKQIGLDRGGRGKAHLKVVEMERVKWDLFVSQAPETTGIIKRAYALDDQVIETGYPRNDELGAFDDAARRAVRERLGIDADSVVVMYAPTWREDVQGEVTLLDLEQLGGLLGPGYTLLRRGHVRTLGTTSAARADNVIDVSTYPQINDLLGVADVLITDYSSMMFDFTVTGRPLIFYTPDIDDYTDAKVRGSYFDLEERAPGPVVREVGDVLRLLRTLDSWPADHAYRYEAWQRRYNVLDDGQAARRALEALLAFEPAPSTPTGRDVHRDAVLASDTEGPESESSVMDEL